MTVNSYYYQKPVPANIFPKIVPNINIKRAKRFSQNYVSEAFKDNKKGFVLSFWVVSIAMGLCMIGASLYFQSVNSDIDYRITEAKDKLKVLEIENADLKTNWVENITPDYVIDWAKNNGFVKNNNVSYFDADQSPVLSLNHAN